MTLSSLVNVLAGTTTGTATLIVVPTININSFTINAGSTANFVATLSQSTTQAITFNYVTGGTATATTDYTTSTGTATIAAGATTFTLPVTTFNSGGGKNVTMTLSSLVNVNAGTIVGTATLTVVPTINIANLTTNAGTNANFVVTLSVSTTQAITFNYATADGTAHQPADYTSSSGTATIGAGATTLTLPGVVTFNSGGGKNFNMVLSSIVNVLAGTTTGIATLTVVPTISINSVTVNAGANANFIVSLSQATTQSIIFNYATGGGTATAVTDYATGSGTATILAGATSYTLPSVATLNSGGGKYFNMTLATLVNANAGTIVGVGTMIIVPSISVNSFSVNAGSTANFVATLSQTTTQAITFNYTTGGTATATTDYTTSTGTATIAAGATTFTMPVTTFNSGGGKNVTMTLSSLVNVNPGTTTGTATLIVVPTINIASLTTNAGTTANFVVTLSALTSQAITFNYATGGGTATAVTDYATSSGTATIAAGATTLTLPAITTQISGGGKTFNMVLSSPVNVVAGTMTGVATLTVVPTINIANLTQTSGTTFGFVVSLSTATTQNITFNYATGGGTATAGTDYTSGAASATISAGATSITLPGVATTATGGGKTFNMVLSSIVNAVSGTITGVGTMLVQPTININSIVVNAGSNASFVVTLTTTSTGNVIFNYATSNGTASAGSDYTSASSTATIAAGATTLTLPGVTTNSSGGGKNFNMTLSTINGALSGTLVGVANMNSPFSWTGAAADNKWSTSGNWSTSAVPGPSDTAIFNGNCTGSNCNVTVDSVQSVAGINMNSTYTGIITQTNALTVGASHFTMAGGTFNGGAGALTITGNLNQTSGTITAGAQTISVAGNVSTQTITLTGSTFVLNGAGAQTVTAGSALAFAALTVQNGGLLTLSGLTPSTSGTLTLNNAAGSLSGTINATGNVTATAYSGGSGTINVSNPSGAATETLTGAVNALWPSLTLATNAGTTINLSGTIDLANNFIYTTGTVVAGASTVRLVSNASQTFDPGSISFSTLKFMKTGGTVTASGTPSAATFVQDEGTTGGATYTGGAVNVSTSATTTATTGVASATSTFVVNATGATVAVSSSAAAAGDCFPNLNINTAGVVTLGTNVTVCGAYTVTSVGTLTTTGSTMRLTGGGHNYALTPGTASYNNVMFKPATNSHYALTGTFNIGGTLNFTANGETASSVLLNGGTYSVAGNVTLADAGIGGGTSAVTLTGTSAQSITQSAGSWPTGGMTLNKSSGNLTQATTLALGTQTLTLTSGTWLMAGFNLTGISTLSTATGTNLWENCGTLTYSSYTPANGTLHTGTFGSTMSVAAAADVNEGSTQNFVVSMSPVNCVATTFLYSTSNGTAVAPTNYTAVTNASATIAASAATTTVTVTTIHDGVYTPTLNDSVALSSFSPSDVIAGTITNNGNILNTDVMPTINIGNITPNAGSLANFVVTMTGPSSSAVTFSYTTANVSAIAGTDYTTATGTATMAAGTTTLTLPGVTTQNSSGGKAFNMVLSSVSGAAGGTLTGTATMFVVPSISISSVTLLAGATANFVVTLTQSTTQAITFNYATANTTAIAGTDYTASSGSATISAGATTLTLPVSTAVSGAGKTFSMSLNTLVNVNAGTIAGVASMITTVNVSSPTTNAGTPVNFVVSISPVSASPVTFAYTTANGTASAGTDYTTATGNATIAAGATSTTIAVTSALISGSNKNFTLTISSLVGAQGGTLTGTGTLILLPTININSFSLNAGSTANFVVTLSQTSTQAITFNYATGGTGVAGTDYTASSGTATIAAAATTFTLPVTTFNSGGGKTVTMTLSTIANATAGTIVGTASMIIVPTVNINNVTTTAGSTVNFVATLSQATTQALTFNYATGGGTAVSGTDYTASSGTATIAASATTFTFPVTTFLSGAGKTFNLTLSSFVNVIGGTTVGTATLQSTVTVNNLTAIAGSPAPVVISLNTASSVDVTFAYTTNNGTATAGTDYTTTAGNATILAGATSTTINVTNAASSAGKNFTLTISSLVNATMGTATGTISMVPQINIGLPATVNSGSLVNFVVTLSTTSALNTIFNYTTGNGTAVSGTNYTTSTGTATILAGATTMTLPVITAVYSTGATTLNFTRTISSAVNGIIGTAVNTGTIKLVPVVTVPNITPDAQIAPANFIVTLGAASANDVVFNYTTGGGTATAGTDYTTLSGTATILAGATTYTLAVTTTRTAGGKTFVMSLSGITNATTTTASGTATVFVTPTISIAPVTVATGTNAVFVVTASASTTQNIVFSYSTSDGSGVAGSAYSTRSGTATISSGTTTIGLSGVTTRCLGSGLNFVMTISANTHSVLGTASALGSMTLPTPNLNLTGTPIVGGLPVSINVNSTSAVVLSLSTGTNQAVTFNYATADNTAVAGTDYTASSGSATIASCATSYTLPTLTIAGTGAGKNFTEAVSAITNATGVTTSATVNILAAPNISINSPAVIAGSSAIFVMTMSAVSTSAVTFNYATANGTDTTPAAYTATSGTATIAVGSTTATIPVVTTLAAPAGNFKMSISSIANATGVTTTGTATVTAATASATESSIAIMPNTIPNDNTTAATVYVTIRTPGDVGFAGKTVTLASSNAGTDTITTVQGTTDARGMAIFTVVSSAAHTSTLTATDSTDSVTVTQTATLDVTAAIKAYVYVANQASAMTGYSLNLSTGFLTPVTLTTPPTPKALLATPDSKFLYSFDGTNAKYYKPTAATGDIVSQGSVANTYSIVTMAPTGKGLFTASGTGTLKPYTINTSTGALTIQTSMSAPGGGGYVSLVCDPSSQYVYGGENGPSTVNYYTMATSTAALSGTATFTPAASPTYAAAALPNPYGQIVIYGYTTTLESFTVNADGTLTSIGTSGALTGTGNITSIVTHPNNKWIFAVNSTKINRLAINQTTGALTVSANYAVSGSATHPPGVMTIDPTGQYLLLSEWAGTGNTQGYVGVFSINQATGALTEVASSPFTRGTDTPSCISNCTGQMGVSAVVYP